MLASFGSKLARPLERRRGEYLFLVSVILLAGLLRFYKLGTWSFWLDEIYSVRDAFHLTGQDIVRYTSDPKDRYYPLSYALIRASLAVFGVNEWSARLVPALVGIVSIPLLYFLVRRMFNSTVGLISMLLLAVSPWHVYWSQNARFYSLLFLLCNLSLLTFYLGVERDDVKYMVASGVFLALGILTHVTALLVFSAFVLYPVALKLCRPQLPTGFSPRNVLFFLIPPVPPIVYLVLTVVSRQPSEATTTYVGGNPLRLLLGTSFYIGIPLVCFTLGSLAYSILVKKSRPAMFLGLSAMIPLLLVAAASFLFVVRNRYVFLTLLGWTVLGAYGIGELFSRVMGAGKFLVVAMLIALISGSLAEDFTYYRYQNGNRENWRSAFEYVKQHRVEGDAIAVTFPAAGDYYLGETTLWIPEMEPEEIELSGQRVWFVENDAIDWDYPKIQAWIKKNAMLVAHYDVHVSSARTYKMRVLLYDP